MTSGEIDLLLASAKLALSDDAPEQALELAVQAHKLAAESTDLTGQATSLFIAGCAHHRLTQYKKAVEALQTSSSLRADLEDQSGELECLLELSRAYRAIGEPTLAGIGLNRSLLLSRDLQDQESEADALNGLAAVSYSLGSNVPALEQLRAALEIRRETGNINGEISCLNNLGILLTNQGEYADALDALIHCHTLIQKHAIESETEAECLINIGNVYQGMSQFDRASTNYQRALTIAHLEQFRNIEVIALTNLANMRILQGSYHEAIHFYEETLITSRAMGFRATEIDALEGLARVHIRQGNPSDACQAIDIALKLSRTAGERGKEISLLLDLGETYALLGNTSLAQDSFQVAITSALEHGSKKQLHECQEKLSAFHESTGQIGNAFEHYKKAHRLERELFTEEGERQLQRFSNQFELERARADSEALRRYNEDSKQINDHLEERVRERTIELEEAQVETATCLALAAEYRDDNTGQHTYRVGHLSALLAAAVGLPTMQVELIRIAARLHDVGKIGIADRVLLKPDKLDSDEYNTMKAHTTIGAEILAGGQSPVLQMAKLIALYHHERWDGHGYPQGLSAEAIPIVGRIVSVADVYDALTSARPYKLAWTTEEALVEIERQSGLMFDPNIAPLLREIILGKPEPSKSNQREVEGSSNPSIAFGPVSNKLDAEANETAFNAATPNVSADDSLIDPRTQLDQILAQAWDLRATQPAEFQRISEESLGTAISLAYRRGVGYGRRNLGYLDFMASRYERALGQLSEALEIGRELEDHALVRDSLNFLGGVCTSLGDFVQGVEYVQSTLELCQLANDESGIASALTNLGMLHHHLGQDEEAIKYHRESVHMSQRNGHSHREAMASNNLGIALIGLGQFEEAIDVLTTAQPLGALIGDEGLNTRVLINLSEAYHKLGNQTLALGAINQALDLISDDSESRVYALMNAALIHADLGDHSQALEMLNCGLSIAQASGLKSLGFQIHKHLSRIYKTVHRVDEALEHHEQFYAIEREVLAAEVTQKLRITSAQREIERTRAESEIYRLRNVELARALTSLQEADRLKSQLVKELNSKSLELDRQTKIDALTGIHNRRYLESTLASKFAQSREAGTDLSVVIVDVDHFKEINDRFSHQVGDQVLKIIAGLLLKSCRSEDLVARYGGEEFVIALPGMVASQALIVCERIHKSLGKYDWSSFSPELRITISAGLSDDASASNHEKLLNAADLKLYEAKRSGRNRTCL
jgi:diguanylate cyclase (GGDEF)-like protein/putative nucleotidyltransferase with HDIG domain